MSRCSTFCRKWASRSRPVSPLSTKCETRGLSGPVAVAARWPPVGWVVAGDARLRILEATYTCVARYGLAKTTVEDAARVSGMARATIYRYFPGGRDQLVAEVIAWEAARFFDRLAAAVGDTEG